MGDIRARGGLRGQVVLLTGAASGIGEALSRALRAIGCHVVELDRSPLESDAPGINDGVDPVKGSRHRVVGDVTDSEMNLRAVQVAVDHFGRLDAFIGNAGIHDGGASVLDTPPHDLREIARRVLDVNVVGYLVGAACAAPEVVRNRGTMVFTLSDASFIVSGNGAGAPYAASKHAGLGVVRSLAAQLAPHVRVNAVAPGGIPTPLKATTPDGQYVEQYANVDRALDSIRSSNPLGTVLSADELANHYLFLLSENSYGLTGHVLRPDGGLSLV